MKRLSVAETRDRLTECLREVEAGAVITITRRGEDAAVLIAASEYARLSSAAASADFAAWAQAWRERQPAGFSGITDAEILRWQDLP